MGGGSAWGPGERGLKNIHLSPTCSLVPSLLLATGHTSSRRTCSASGATAQAGDHHFPPSSPCLLVPMPRPHDPKAPSFTFQTVHEIFSRLPHWLTHWKRPRHRFVGPAWDQGRAGDVQTCSGGQTGRWRNTGRLDQADALESSLGTAASPPQGGPGSPFPGLPV